MVQQARLERVASGLAPTTPGWFTVNAADAAWCSNLELGVGACIFESDEFVLKGRPDLAMYEKPHAGFNLRVLLPGHAYDRSHAESVQEDFLVVAGACLVIIEGVERQLRTWDYVHCPPMTWHTFVATGDEPCVLVAAGNRRDDLERVYEANMPPPQGTWEVTRPERWDELPWA